MIRDSEPTDRPKRDDGVGSVVVDVDLGGPLVAGDQDRVADRLEVRLDGSHVERASRHATAPGTPSRSRRPLVGAGRRQDAHGRGRRRGRRRLATARRARPRAAASAPSNSRSRPWPPESTTCASRRIGQQRRRPGDRALGRLDGRREHRLDVVVALGSGDRRGRGLADDRQDRALDRLGHRLVGRPGAGVQGMGQVEAVEAALARPARAPCRRRIWLAMTPELPRAPISAPKLIAAATRSASAFGSTLSASSSAARTVASMLDPVSPSGTGNTFRALISSTLASRLATALLNAARKPRAVADRRGIRRRPSRCRRGRPCSGSSPGAASASGVTPCSWRRWPIRIATRSGSRRSARTSVYRIGGFDLPGDLGDRQPVGDREIELDGQLVLDLEPHARVGQTHAFEQTAHRAAAGEPGHAVDRQRRGANEVTDGPACHQRAAAGRLRGHVGDVLLVARPRATQARPHRVRRLTVAAESSGGRAEMLCYDTTPLARHRLARARLSRSPRKDPTRPWPAAAPSAARHRWAASTPSRLG